MARRSASSTPHRAARSRALAQAAFATSSRVATRMSRSPVVGPESLVSSGPVSQIRGRAQPTREDHIDATWRAGCWTSRVRFVLALACLAGLAFVACGGMAGDACHGQSDCANNLSCVGPDEGPACGIAPMQQCTDDQSCSSGEHCHAIADPCSQTGVGSMCGAACTATSCDVGFRCNATGACEPIPCDEGTTCASYQQCNPTAAGSSGPVYSHTDGCEDVTCTSDDGCSAGEACVNGYCQSSVGECEMVAPVA